VDFTGSFISGTCFYLTGEAWMTGYWWWVCPLISGGGHFQSTGPTKCALWQVDKAGTAHLVPGSVVTSGTLTAGQWNYIPLAAAIPLSLGGTASGTPQTANVNNDSIAVYVIAVGCNSSFPDTNNYWGSGQPGDTLPASGPLLSYTAAGGTRPIPISPGAPPQGCFSTAGSDPSLTFPGSASGTDNFWADIALADYTTGAPAAAPLRLWPSFPTFATAANGDTTAAMSGTAFTLSRACSLAKIWMCNPPGSTGLPSRAGIWTTPGHALVAGTDSGAGPAWKNSTGAAASAGDGWIYVDYSGAGVTLPAGSYLVGFFNGNTVKCYPDPPNYFFAGSNPVGGAAVGGPGQAGISWGAGILTAPNVASGPVLTYDDASGSHPGQCAYQPGPTSFGPPLTFEATADWGETRTADVEVIPLATSTAAAAAASDELHFARHLHRRIM